MSPISFDLHKLGWKNFEDLTGCILKEVMGQSFQRFSEGPDGGRDGAYYGNWMPREDEILSGSFTVQCKHTSKFGKSLPKSVINQEVPKIRKLVSLGLADHYLFVTNYTLSAGQEQKARNLIIESGAESAHIFGADWINSKITEHPKLRRLVPRLYGLGDLTQIVTHQAFRQAQEVLNSLVPDLNCFVPTAAYKKSAHALSEHGFVLLLGEPASGKTMITNLLAFSAADEWNLQTLIISSAEEFNYLWNPDDPGQFLWVDDAFGTTQYDPDRVREWNQRLPLLKSAVHRGARAVFTSRDYIFNAAKIDLKSSFFELFDSRQTTIEVEKLTEMERKMILYNHLKCGTQSVEFRRTVKPWLADAVMTPRFLPETARRFANPRFTDELRLNANSVRDFFKFPLKFLEEVLSNLAPAEKAAIALVFTSGGCLPIPVPENNAHLRTIAAFGSNIGDVKSSLNALNGSLVRRVTKDDTEHWSFRHPTIRDAFATLVGSNPELIDVYLAGTTTKKILAEVTCGQMNHKGVKIIVPPTRYQEVMEKLKEEGRNASRLFDSVSNFLAYRCNGNFLEKYFTTYEPMASLPNEIVYPNSIDCALKILIRLHDSGHLMENVRQSTIERFRYFVNRDIWSQFMNEPIKRLLTKEEKETLFAEIKDIVLSNGIDLVDDLKSSWAGEEPVDDLFSTYNDTLAIIADETDDFDELDQVSELLDEVDNVVAEMEMELPEYWEYEPLEAEEIVNETETQLRDIFDDVDA